MENIGRVIGVVLAGIVSSVLPGLVFWLLYNVTGFANSFDLTEVNLWQSVVGCWIVALVGALWNGTSATA